MAALRQAYGHKRIVVLYDVPHDLLGDEEYPKDVTPHLFRTKSLQARIAMHSPTFQNLLSSISSFVIYITS